MLKCQTSIVGAAACAVAFLTVASPAVAEPVEIVALGDSLTAGFGVGPGEAFPEQLEVALRARGHDVEVINAGVSGDTSSGGLSRLEWSVPADAEIVIVELGANDALRGIGPDVTRESLSGILSKLKERNQEVLLAGMLAPRNLDDDYAAAFESVYTDLAAEYAVAFYPFFLDGVAANPSLNQADGIHPNAAGVARIVESMVPLVETLVEEATAER